MARRTRTEQSKHDRKVRQIVRQYERKGWNVNADIVGYDRPDTIGGKWPRRPDIVATTQGTRHIVEVETRRGTDQKQHEVFRRSVVQRNGTKFRLVYANGSG